MNLTDFISNFKEIIFSDPAKRNMFLLGTLFFMLNGYLYKENQDLKEENKLSKKNCDDMLFKAQSDYLIQLDDNRKISQKQINKFITESNDERDSIYKVFSVKINTLQLKINRGIEDLNNIKHENTN